MGLAATRPRLSRRRGHGAPQDTEGGRREMCLWHRGEPAELSRVRGQAEEEMWHCPPALLIPKQGSTASEDKVNGARCSQYGVSPLGKVCEPPTATISPRTTLPPHFSIQIEPQLARVERMERNSHVLGQEQENKQPSF